MIKTSFVCPILCSTRDFEVNRLIMITEISVARWAKSDREKKELGDKFIKDFALDSGREGTL